jgi:coenzyme PQQ precursor peptide PqqA
MHDCLSRPVFHGFGKRTHFLPLRAPMIWVIGQQVWHRRSLAIGHSDATSGIWMQPRSRKSCSQITILQRKNQDTICAAVIRCYYGYLRFRVLRLYYFDKVQKEHTMAWTTPVLVEICIGLEINGYMPADGYVRPEF